MLRSVEGIVIEAVKWAEDGSGFIVRGYEPLGQRANMSLEFGYDVESVQVVNVLEEDAADLAQIEAVGNRVSATLRPFQILTLKVGCN